MSYVVLDTDVSSLILRDRLTGPLVARLTGRAWCVTFVTVGELWQWADLRAWGAGRRAALESWLTSVVVLPYGDQPCRTWGRISAAATRRRRPRPANDTWIAATCLSHNLPLATRNTKDFQDFADRDGLVLL